MCPVVTNRVVGTSLPKMSTYISSASQSLRRFGEPEKVKFTLPPNLREVLEDVIEDKDHRKYQNLLCIIRDADISDPNMCALLHNCQELIPLLDHRLKHLVQVLLMIRWTERSDEAIESFQNFLLDLCSAHNYYVQNVLEHLLDIFKNATNKVWETEEPPPEAKYIYSKVHNVIEKILMLLPLSGRVLHQVAISSFPYLKRPAHELQGYVYNLLEIPRYAPNLRSAILRLVINKLTAVDSSAPRNEILEAEEDPIKTEELDFKMDIDGENEEQGMKHPMGNVLDILMTVFFRHLRNESLNEAGQCDWERVKNIYKYMLTEFEQVSLLTTGTCHTQFHIFYICSLKPLLGEAFLQFLWRQVLIIDFAPYTRQTAVAYIASFLARAAYVPLGVVKTTLQQMAEWIHRYIQSQDSMENAKHGVRPHAVFYSVCQALFYVVAFRHRDLVNTRNNIVFLQGLNMSKMVTSQLNPLKVCSPAVVSSFAAIMRTYQLVYCYGIIERNSRNVLPTVSHNEDMNISEKDTAPCAIDSYFPFDPYVLKRSSQFISPHYRAYTEADVHLAEETVVKKCEEDDDFLSENPPLASGLNESLFTYGTSPGFRQNH